MSFMKVIKGDLGYGFAKEDALAHLADKHKQAIIKLIARASEASYRRGFQQGLVMSEQCRKAGKEPNELFVIHWRFDSPADQAPWVLVLDGKFTRSNYKQTAIERLFMEHDDLEKLGLDKPRKPSTP